MPLLALAALYGAEMVQRQAISSAEVPFFRAQAPRGVRPGFAVLLPPIMADLETIRFVTFAAIKKNWDSTETLQSTQLRDFRFVREGTRRAEMEAYMKDLDEGFQLLRRHSEPEMRLNALLFADPFHTGLG